MKKQTIDYIYQSFMIDVYRYLLSLCQDSYIVEDIVQETFFRAYLHIESCPKNGVKPWLFKIARNVYIDFRRKNSRSYAEKTDFFNSKSDYRTPEDEVLMKEQLREINYLIDKMPENHKQAILLCDFNGMSYKEASEIMGVSLAHLKVLLFRARQRIRQKSREE